MVKNIRGKNGLFYLLAIVIIVGTLFYRMSDLTTDPPMYFSGLGQTFSTDPGQYVHHARNKMLFGESDPFDYPRWKVYQQSLTSAAAYLWFSVAGVSLEQANMVGVLLSTIALIFFVLAVSRDHRPWVTTAVAFVCAINVCLTVYGRLSYLENGLLLLTALLFFVYSRWGDQLWGLVVAGILASFAMLTGKLFGVLLLPAVLLTVYFSHHQRRWSMVIVTLASFVATSLVLVFALYGTDIGAVIGYFTEQSYGLRGAPAGLTSPWGFIEHLISYGFDNRLFFLSIDLELFLLWGGVLLTFLLAEGRGLSGMSSVGRLALFSGACIFLGLMPLNYSPLRYALFLIPAIVIFCVAITDNSLRIDKKASRQFKPYHFVPLFLLLWHTLFQVIGIIVFMNDLPKRSLVWATLPAALAGVLLIRWLMTKRIFRLSKQVIYIGLAVLLTFSLGLNIHRTIQRVRFAETHNFVECGEDLRSILGDDAVVSGPYAPVLTINNDLKCFIHLFGVAEVDSTLFDRYPVTHLAVDVSNWAEAEKQYPILKDLPVTTIYVIRDYVVRICNISKLFGNAQANSYRETGFERAVRYNSLGHSDSAFVELSHFLAGHPDCRSGKQLMTEFLLGRGQYDEALSMAASLVARYPTDYYTCVLCGRVTQVVALVRNDRRLLDLAKSYYERAVHNDPFRSDYVNGLYQRTMQQVTGGSGSRQSGL